MVLFFFPRFLFQYYCVLALYAFLFSHFPSRARNTTVITTRALWSVARRLAQERVPTAGTPRRRASGLRTGTRGRSPGGVTSARATYIGYISVFIFFVVAVARRQPLAGLPLQVGRRFGSLPTGATPACSLCYTLACPGARAGRTHPQFFSLFFSTFFFYFFFLQPPYQSYFLPPPFLDDVAIDQFNKASGIFAVRPKRRRSSFCGRPVWGKPIELSRERWLDGGRNGAYPPWAVPTGDHGQLLQQGRGWRVRDPWVRRGRVPLLADLGEWQRSGERRRRFR